MLWTDDPPTTEIEDEMSDSTDKVEVIIQNINLNSGAAEQSFENSGIDIDRTLIESITHLSSQNDEDENGFKIHSNCRKNIINSNNKRTIENISPEEASTSKALRNGNNSLEAASSYITNKQTELAKTANLVFIKGISVILTKQHPGGIKKALLNIDNSLKDEQIKYAKESLRIACRDENQKRKLMSITFLMGIDVTVTEHKSQNRASIDLEQYEKVIIFGVSMGLTDDEIKHESKAITVKRLLKKERPGGDRIPTESVVLSYVTDPPATIQIGYQTFKTKTFIPLPIRCWRCQHFGHSESSCRGKVTCPRCAQNHKYEDCPLAQIDVQRTSLSHDNDADLLCVNCKSHHSAAFRGCPEYLKSKEITKIKAIYKISYAEAADKLKEKEKSNIPPHPEFHHTISSASTQDPFDRQDPSITPLFTPLFQLNPTSLPNPSEPSLFSHSLHPLTNSNFPYLINPTSTPSHPIPPPHSTNPLHIPSTHYLPPNLPQTTSSTLPHLDIFITKLLFLIVQLLSAYLPRETVVTKLNNFIKTLSSQVNIDQETLHFSL